MHAITNMGFNCTLRVLVAGILQPHCGHWRWRPPSTGLKLLFGKREPVGPVPCLPASSGCCGCPEKVTVTPNTLCMPQVSAGSRVCGAFEVTPGWISGGRFHLPKTKDRVLGALFGVVSCVRQPPVAEPAGHRSPAIPAFSCASLLTPLPSCITELPQEIWCPCGSIAG